MAGRQYTEEYVYAFLRRWDDLRGQWVDHFPQNVLVEVIMSGGRPTLLCRTYNGPQSFQCPIDGAAINRTSNEVFEIFTNQNRLQLYFRTIADADVFHRQLGNLPVRDNRPQFNQPMQHQSQFDGGGPSFQSHGQQQFNQPPPNNQQYEYDRQYNQGQYDQQRYPQQNQRWDQHQQMGGPGPGARDNIQYNNGQPLYQNVPLDGQYGGSGAQGRQQSGGGGGAPHGGGGAPYGGDGPPYGGGGGGPPYGGGRGELPHGGGGGPPYGGGGAPYGNNQGQYDARPHQQPGMNYNQQPGMNYNQQPGMNYNQQPGMNYNQQPGMDYSQRPEMNRGQHGAGMQFGAQQGYQQSGPPGRGVQDVPNRPKEVWVDKQKPVSQPFNISNATAELASAINEMNLQRAYKVIEELDKNLERSDRTFNVQLDYYGDIQTHEEEPVKEEEKNEFRLKVAIERQCAPNEMAIDIIIKAKEDDTIEQLVKLFETQYNIPGEVQRWIIKQQLASDKSKWSLKDFGVTKNGGPEQEVYLFVIQGMKERIKQEFLNKRQQQVEDDQRQQQQIAQQENFRKQTQITSNTMTSVMPSNVVPPQHHQYQRQQPYHDQQDQQSYQGQAGQQYQQQGGGGYMDRAPAPIQALPQNMGPSLYHEQRTMEPVAAAQPPLRQQSQPQYQPQQQQQQQHVFADPPVDRFNPDPRPPPVDRFNPDPRPPARIDYQPKQEPLRVHQPLYQAEMQLPPPLPPQNNPPRGAAGGIQVFPTMPLQKTQSNEGPPPVAAKPISIGNPEKPRGWNCSVCTFLNEPFRPGCKMCSAPPPEGYEPPADHVPTAEEMKFINNT